MTDAENIRQLTHKLDVANSIIENEKDFNDIQISTLENVLKNIKQNNLKASVNDILNLLNRLKDYEYYPLKMNGIASSGMSEPDDGRRYSKMTGNYIETLPEWKRDGYIHSYEERLEKSMISMRLEESNNIEASLISVYRAITDGVKYNQECLFSFSDKESSYRVETEFLSRYGRKIKFHSTGRNMYDYEVKEENNVCK